MENVSKIQWVITLLTDLSSEDFTGKVEINWFKGNVSNINKSESFKAPIEK